MSIWHALPTPWPSMQLTPSLIGGKIIQMVLGLILLLHSMTSKTWLKKALHFNFLRWNVRSSLFLQILLFYLILPTPRFKQLLFGGSYSENPKNLKHTSLDVYSQNASFNTVSLIVSELFNRNLSTVHPTLFFKFLNSLRCRWLEILLLCGL